MTNTNIHCCTHYQLIDTPNPSFICTLMTDKISEVLTQSDGKLGVKLLSKVSVYSFKLSVWSNQSEVASVINNIALLQPLVLFLSERFASSKIILSLLKT